MYYSTIGTYRDIGRVLQDCPLEPEISRLVYIAFEQVLVVKTRRSTPMYMKHFPFPRKPLMVPNNYHRHSNNRL